MPRLKAPAIPGHILSNKMKKYERLLIEIASFKDGKEVGSHFDEPGSAQKAREALGARICKRMLKKLEKDRAKL